MKCENLLYEKDRITSKQKLSNLKNEGHNLYHVTSNFTIYTVQIVKSAG